MFTCIACGQFRGERRGKGEEDRRREEGGDEGDRNGSSSLRTQNL